MRIFCDIDGTICVTEGSDYQNAKPILKAIKKMNNHFCQGDTVIYWTSRGNRSGIDWSEFTKIQLKVWGCLYHDLLMNKPSFDVFYDDKAFNAIELIK